MNVSAVFRLLRGLRRPFAALLVNALSACGSFGQEPAINFREPAREYNEVRRGGLVVAVESSLEPADAPLAARAIDRLAKERVAILAALPTGARDRLARVRYFLMQGPEARGGGKGSGLEYVQPDALRAHAELDPRWGDAIVIYCARNSIEISDLWARKALLHELAHAYQLEQWPEHESDIQHAWDHARDGGLYRDVRDVETRRTIPRAYALTNQLEYFAELSCMYFARCNYQPTDRRELEKYDPVGHAMIRKMWRVDD